MSSFPHRIVGQINEIDERTAMGLPKHYTECTAENIKTAFAAMCDRGLLELVALVENPDMPVEVRVAAGIVLGLRGDPRIDVREPTMVTIPGGEVAIGLAESDVDSVVKRYAHVGVQHDWIAKETPRHLRTLSPFALARFPVTNAEFLEFLKATGHDELPSSWTHGRYPFERANHPVHSISIESALRYIEWLNLETDRRFRLLSESEWEHAAAGPYSFEFPWGDRDILDAANTLESGLLTTSPVGSFPLGRSYYGADDMAGNVEELVADRYRPYPGGAHVRDDLSEKLGDYPIARGGSYCRFRDLARCTRRHGPYPSPLYAVGFRLAEDV